MSEVQYAKSFLGLLESRPIKYNSDYVVDARTLPPQNAYILPRMPKPYSKRARTDATTAASASNSSSTTLTITLKPLRASATGPNFVTVKDQSPDSSIYDVKAACAKQAGYAVDKVKILWERKPVGDSKTVKEVVGEDAKAGAEVEMGVMFMGQPTLAPGGEEQTQKESSMPEISKENVNDKPAAGGDVEAPLQTDEFWSDLHGFMLQRLQDESASARLVEVFRSSWKSTKS